MLSFRRFNPEPSQRVREILKKKVEFVADVADAEAGLLADFIVFELAVVFEVDELAVGAGEFGDEKLEGAEGFEFAEGVFGSSRSLGSAVWLAIV